MNFVLLTAAVTPNPLFQSTISDAEIRLNQYQLALAFWANKSAQLGWKTIVVETTGCPPEKLVNQIPPSILRDVDVITYETNDEITFGGKGAVEASAIDYALNTSRFAMKEDSALYKATGRLTVRNADVLLAKVPSNSVYVRRSIDRRYCDTRFFGTTVGFWRNSLSGMAGEVDDSNGRYLEHVMAHRLTDAEYGSESAVLRFGRRPLIGGISGTTGATYGQLSSLKRDLILRPFEGLLHKTLTRKQV